MLCIVILATIGIEVLVILSIPDMGICKESGVIALHIIYKRVALEFILIVTQLHTLNADNILSIGIVVALIRLKAVLLINNNATTCIGTNITLGIEGKVIGIHCCRTIYDLDNIRVDACLVLLSIVLSPIAIDIG